MSKKAPLEVKIWAPKSKGSLGFVDHKASKTHWLSPTSNHYYHYDLQHQALPFQYSLEPQKGQLRPDPRGRFMPTGVHGHSEWPESHFHWRDGSWKGLSKDNLIVYELHIGTFSPAGNFLGCLAQLDYLQALGINAIELMPVAQCPGKWNWGYDGVGLYAVNHNYGTPDEFKQLVDECHHRGISVILDVVYNHVGPEGNYLHDFGPYFSQTHHTPWGDAFDFDGEHQRFARDFVIDNALYWLSEYHLDGLRLDAIHFMFDESDYPIQQELCDRVREMEKSVARKIHLIGESNVYDNQLIRGEGDNYCAIWADDLMHSIYSLAGVNSHLTPREYLGKEDVLEVLRHGYIYEGPQVVRTPAAKRKELHQQAPREHISSLVIALQTHDSAGNHPQGQRIHMLTSMAFQRAAASLVLLYPAIPMIFMGEEFASNSPFLFFSDFSDQSLRDAVDKGRKSEFPDCDHKDFVNPSDERAFHDSKIVLANDCNPMLQWYKSLIALRQQGLREGWLAADTMEVGYADSQGVFYLQFSQYAVAVRLSGIGDSAEAIPYQIDPSMIVLNSEPSFSGEILANHALVIKTDEIATTFAH